tara:strand:- start:41 stop:343 length:303 start_codon:yes stop_codon:yes gene_type:complete
MESKMIKLAGLVTEKKELGGAYIDQLYDLTDKNNHTRARAELARHVGDKRLIKAYEGLMYVEDILRDANDTSKARARLDKILFLRVKKQFDDWNQILGAF